MRYVFIAVLLSLVVHLSWASPSDIESDMRYFSSLGSRADGTEGEKEAFTHIAGKLNKLNISFSIQALGNEKRGHSFSRNIIAEIPGSVPGRYIIAAPVDNGAFATALLLELAEKFITDPPENTIVLAFLGAERGESRYHPFGSRKASSLLYREKNIFTVYLDSEVPPKKWELKIGGNGKVAPYWFTRTLSFVLSSSFTPYKLRGTDIQVARLGLQGDIGPLQSWLDSNIPTILLKGSGTVRTDDAERQTGHFVNALIKLDKELRVIPEYMESVYIFLRPFPGSIPRSLSELPYITVFLIISALILVAILMRLRDVRLNLRRFSRHWWAGPLLFIIVFLFFFLSTLIVEETLLLADFPTIWTYAPGTFIFFKIAIAAALSLNFILITRGLPLPRSPHFYSYAAIITSGLASLVFSALDITLANIRRKTIYLILSIIPSTMGLVVIIREPYSMVIRSLLLSRITASFILTLLIFPIILAFTSLSYWRLHYDRVRHSVLTPAATLALSLSSIITLFWILGMNPFSPENPQPLEIIDSIDLVHGERKLEISSPAPIGNADLHLDGQTYPLENLGRTADVRMPFNRKPISLESQSRSFLGRRTISVEVSGEPDPENLTIHLNSSEPFTLHEANYPFEMAPSGTSAEIFIGENPPFPILLEFTVNNDAQLIFSVTGKWLNPEDPPLVTRPDIDAVSVRAAHLEASI